MLSTNNSSEFKAWAGPRETKLTTNMKESLSLSFVAVCAVLVTGCGTIPTVLPPEARAKVNQTTVHCSIPQKEVEFEFMMSGYGAGLGLIGAIVDAGVNASMSASAEGRAKKLRAEVNDLDFRSTYWQAITNAVAESAWLQLQSFDLKATNMSPMKAPMVAGHSAMNIGTSYRVTPDCRVLKVTTGLDFYLPDKPRRPAAMVMVSYYSKEIGTEEGNKALALWTANRGAAYRRAVAEGVEESTKLLKHALELMGGTSAIPGRPAQLKAKLVHGRADFGIPVGKVGLRGNVLEEAADRVIFQVEHGGLFSFPGKEVEIKYLKN